MSRIQNQKIIKNIYQILYHHLGPQHWWPGDTPLEISIGAILTQNTAWVNVEKAISHLKKAGFLYSSKNSTPWGQKLPNTSKNIHHVDIKYLKKLNQISEKKLASYIRPAGYFNVKAKRLKNFISWIIGEYGDFKKFSFLPLNQAREALLAVNGIGCETADSILLYALYKPIFVVDAYTKRILSRHDLIDFKDDYHQVQNLMMQSISPKTQVYNEYHALMVNVGKNFCKTKKPLCLQCPLNGLNWEKSVNQADEHL